MRRLLASLLAVWDVIVVVWEVACASWRGELDDLPEPGVAVPPADPAAARRWHEERGLEPPPRPPQPPAFWL